MFSELDFTGVQVSDTGDVLIIEEDLEQIVYRHYESKNEKFDGDSTKVMDFAAERGFQNLGDFGYGYVFYVPKEVADEFDYFDQYTKE